MEAYKFSTVERIIILLLFIIVLTGAIICRKDKEVLAIKRVNPIPPVQFITKDDITIENINETLNWITDNFTVLYYIAKVQKGDTLFIVGR